MDKKQVIILGSSGMLGMIVTKVFSEDESIDVIGTVKDKGAIGDLGILKNKVKFKIFDVKDATIEDYIKLIKGADWVINAIGIIKPYIHDDNAEETEVAIKVNSLFPYYLAKAAEKTNVKVLQIATDCVYSGLKGKYVETDAQDPIDVYGKSKSLGEIYSDSMFHLRCSIIGPEPRAHVSLMDWFLKQEKGATLNGYANHMWNGITTLHFGKICLGIVKSDLKMGHIQHIIPGDSLSKYEMLKSFAKYFKRSDLTINKTNADKIIDRTLGTIDAVNNKKIWKKAGYDKPPTVDGMIKELSEYISK